MTATSPVLRRLVAALTLALTFMAGSVFSPRGARADLIECTLAEVAWFAGNFAPDGWHLADGTLLSISQNTALFALLGTTYGGNGETTFALPDLRGRSSIGVGTGPGLTARLLGETGGAETQTLTAGQMPNHSHTVPAHSHSLRATTSFGDSGSPAGRTPAVGRDGDKATVTSYRAIAPNTSLRSGTVSTAAATTTGATGGGQAFSTRDPSLVLTPIICMEGTFPSQN